MQRPEVVFEGIDHLLHGGGALISRESGGCERRLYPGEFAIMIEGEDERIQGGVRDRLAAELPARAAQIQADVTRGEVTLPGTVDTSEALCRAEHVAGSVAGVVSVMNNPRVRQPGGTGATG